MRANYTSPAPKRKPKFEISLCATASSATLGRMKLRLPLLLFGIYLVEFAVLAIQPVSRGTWIS